MANEFDHLTALRQGLYRERDRLASAKKPGEIALRKVWVSQAEKEIAAEIAFLAKRGIVEATLDDIMSDDELLAELSA